MVRKLKNTKLHTLKKKQKVNVQWDLIDMDEEIIISDQYIKEYRQKELAKESSSFIKFVNEWQNKRYHEVTKNSL